MFNLDVAFLKSVSIESQCDKLLDNKTPQGTRHGIFVIGNNNGLELNCYIQRSKKDR